MDIGLEPIISGLSRNCGTDVNILGANTKNIDGVAYGQMLIQLLKTLPRLQRSRITWIRKMSSTRRKV